MIMVLFCNNTVMANGAIKFVLPYQAGGQSDQVFRIVQSRLSQELGKPVVAEYKPGAGGQIAAAHVANASGPEITLLFNTIGLILDNSTDKPYQLQDLVHVATLATFDSLLVAPANGKITNWNEYTKLSNNDTANFGAVRFGGLWVSVELLRQQTNKNLTFVPYKGTATIINDILGNHLDLAPMSVGFVTQHIQAGKIVAIAAISKQRLPNFPNVPTLVEKGVNVDGSENWVAVFANRSARNTDIQAVSSALGKVLKDPEVVKKFKELGYTISPKLDLNNRNFLESQQKKHSKLMKTIEVNQ